MEATTLTYDAENQLTGVSGGASASFVYDGDGNRVKATFGDSTIAYVGDYFEWTGSTNDMVKYYYANGQRVAMREGSSTRYYLLTDHLGSTAITANSSGTRVAELRYKAWGETRYTDGATPTTYRFTGQRLDESTGLMYYGARYYDPALGRFVQADTIVPNPGNPQDLNRYAYVRNNPLRYTDPTGHRICVDAECTQVEHVVSGQYIYTRDYGFFDTSHMGTGDPGLALEQAREAVGLRETGLVYFYQRVKGGLAYFEGGYEIRGDLVEPEQAEGVVLAMYQDWSIRFEYWEGSFTGFGRGTSFAVEDLPSHHLGFYEATGMSREEIFEHLGGVDYVTDSEPSRVGEIENREFTPLVQMPGRCLRRSWPAPLDAISPITDPVLWSPAYFKSRIVVGPVEVPWLLGRTTWQAK